MRPLLLVGGAPRLTVDAVRFLSVRASGATAVALGERLRRAGAAAELLLGVLAAPDAPARRYDSRADLEASLRSWVIEHPHGVVLMSAAVNDYDVAGLEARLGGEMRRFAPGDKAPSGAEELVIRLRPAGKVIDHLRSWGLTGPIVGFKYEAASTVITSAQALQLRTGAALVVANSLCGTVQALVDVDRVDQASSREVLLDRLTDRLLGLATG